MAAPKDFKCDSFTKLSKTKYASVKDATRLSKLKHDRVNMLRQMVPDSEKTRDNVNAMPGSLTAGDQDRDKFKVVHMQSLELLRKAERDRQKWIKDEIALGNTENAKSLLQSPGLDDVIRI
jgi:hypothetical protein